ncbi:MAG: hypothetical protein QM682_17165 [Paracoccus sp. (in: a-proteobacteria)]|uniref:hypothetical protein n=1 Tax=Paracoccus sp. TaxID=267 RepID=UPI0039E35A91
MLTETQIDELTTHARACGVAAVEIATESWSLRLEPGLAVAPPPAPPPTMVKAPGMGRFHPAARRGEVVARGQVIGFLRTGALLRPLRASASGTLSALLAGPGDLIGYAQEIAAIQPDGGQHAA